MTEWKWCAVDGEGDVGKLGLLGVAFYSDIHQAYVTDHDLALAILIDHAAQGYTFVCHNAGYDIPVVFHQLGLDVSVHHYNGRFNCGYWKWNTRRPSAQIWDSGSISGIRRLADLGKGIGYPKYPTPQRLTGEVGNTYQWKCDTHDVWECEQCYAIRDAEIPYRFMVAFTAQLHGWGVEPGKTISAIAMDVWKALERPEPIGLTNRKIEVLAREAYAGGRVETFKLGHTGPIWCADISSAYLAAMRETPYPAPDAMLYATHYDPERIPWHLEGVAEVSVTVPPMYMPPLPYIHQGERTFPIGTLQGCWTLHELAYARSLGCRVTHCERVAFSTRSVTPFVQYCDIMWSGRQDAKARHDPRELLFKLLGNNLYGRIGMSDDIERRIVREWTGRTTMGQLLGSNWTLTNKRLYLDRVDTMSFENHWKNVLWAAQTTAAVRIKLHQFALLQGDNLVYSDTDSIFSRAPIIGLSDGLGGLRDDGHYENALIAGPKLYALQSYESDMPEMWASSQCTLHGHRRCQECRWKARAKGVPRIHALSFLRHGTARFDRPIRLTESNRLGIKAGTWIEVERTHHPRPHRRTPINPERLDSLYGWSDTLAPVVS